MPKQTSTSLRELDSGSIQPIKLGFLEAELSAVDALARKYGVARDEIVRFAVRLLVRDYDAGKVSIPTERKQTRVSLRMP